MFHKVAVAYIQSKKKVKMNDYFKYIIIMRLHCNIDECLRIVPKYDFLAWVSLLRWLNINYIHEPCLSFTNIF